RRAISRMSGVGWKSASTCFVESLAVNARTITVPPNRQSSPVTFCFPSSSESELKARRMTSRVRAEPDGCCALMPDEKRLTGLETLFNFHFHYFIPRLDQESN